MIIDVNVTIYIKNLGDGSVTAMFFKNEAEAEKFAVHDDERYNDDIFSETIKVDTETGLILVPPIDERISEYFDL